jgi:hypothetical protein
MSTAFQLNPYCLPTRLFSIRIAPPLLADALRALEHGDDDERATTALGHLIDALQRAEAAPWGM